MFRTRGEIRALHAVSCDQHADVQTKSLGSASFGERGDLRLNRRYVVYAGRTRKSNVMRGRRKGGTRWIPRLFDHVGSSTRYERVWQFNTPTIRSLLR